MSNFNCEYCNTVIVENADGMYTTECEHYPLKLSNLAKRSPILALADILAGEFCYDTSGDGTAEVEGTRPFRERLEAMEHEGIGNEQK